MFRIEEWYFCSLLVKILSISEFADAAAIVSVEFPYIVPIFGAWVLKSRGSPWIIQSRSIQIYSMFSVRAIATTSWNKGGSSLYPIPAFRAAYVDGDVRNVDGVTGPQQ